MTLFEPTVRAIGVIVEIWTAGMPTFSISFSIAAPQRVLVPQVEVRMTPSTPTDLRRSAMRCPIDLALAKLEATPAVADITG